ncbi:unnamed protein product [Pipistrellus nathusii]|uniref:Uncharacterized protein n=1 Tax=Pipistrellus nathusii TaxID=59473 RepID=A0ABP0A6U6_PIPNA
MCVGESAEPRQQGTESDLVLKRAFLRALSAPSSSVTFPAVVPYGTYYFQPHTVPTRTHRPLISILLFTSLRCQLSAKSTRGLELGRGSAYNSGKAQGNLYATRPAHPPLLAWAKNSQ